MELTHFEKLILNSIATSEYNNLNGGIPKTIEDSSTWLFVDELADENKLTMNQVKGVLGSLVKKSMINIDDYNSDETLIQLTQNGIDEIWSNWPK